MVAEFGPVWFCDTIMGDERSMEDDIPPIIDLTIIPLVDISEDEPEEIAAVAEEHHPAMDLALDALPPPLVDLTRMPHRAPPVVDLTVEPLIDLTFEADEEITID
jgi:hypothetical protein